MDNKKRNIIITIVVVALILVGGLVYFILNYTSDKNSLTVVEKKWLTDNVNNIVDVNVYNDIPVYGYNGEGIIFDFLDYFTKETKINFNKISYYTDSSFNETDISFQILDSNEKIGKQDVVLFRDHYVILSFTSSNSISLEDNFTLGVLKSDIEIANNYFNDNIETVEYENIDTLISAIKENQVNYIMLPNLSHMDEVLVNKLNVVYHVEDLGKTFILRAKDNIVYNILNKTYNEYLNDSFDKDYSVNYMNLYYKSTNTSDLLQKNYNAKTYHYGYVVNMPYENSVNNKFVGTILNYLKTFEDETGVEIETTKYKSVDDLKSALVSGDIDFALGNFNYDNINLDYVLTNPISNLEYVVLSKNKHNINSLRGLKDKNVSVVSSSILYQELTNNNIKPKNYSNSDELLRSLDDNSIAIMDKQTYIYYKNSKLKDYNIILEGTLKDSYRFILNSSNEPFNSVFSYFVNTINYQTIKYNYYTNITLTKDYTTIKIFVFIIALVLFLIASVLLINKKSVTNTVISKDEKLKYIDPMTSLKNRNYLNLNIYKWDDNVIFPQSVVVMDINRLSEINDTYGREQGDEIVNKVASVLINNQLENTDIIRSGGDEFLIYMVGYDEKEVVNYTKKLIKEMKDIPNSLGVEVGHSMILDEVKTVDDAINEAITMMNKNKEKKKNKE